MRALGRRTLVWLLLVASGVGVSLTPPAAPLVAALVLAAAWIPWRLAWRGAEGTALRGTLVWGGLALCLGLGACWAAIGVAPESGRPAAGVLVYLMTATILAGLTTVLNARGPREWVWAILMALLVFVFLMPWWEGAGRARAVGALGRLRLESPWTLFYGFLGVAGIANYLPTRYGRAASVLGAALVVEFLGLWFADWPPSRRASCWTWTVWLFGASWWVAWLDAPRLPRGRNELERLWFWFRDHWGAVWALRIAEQFNRSASLGGWPIRLTWEGIAPAVPGAEVPAEVPERALATFRGLIRRFARPERLDRAATRPARPTRPSEDPRKSGPR